MPRPCSICEHKARNEIDRSLLEMPIVHTTIRGIARRFQVSEDSLARHRDKHLSEPVTDVMEVMKEARRSALAEIGKTMTENTISEVKTEVAMSTASRLNKAANHIAKMQEIQRVAANLLDQALEAQDLRAAGIFLRELREQIKLWAELTGKLRSYQQYNQYNLWNRHQEEINSLSSAELDKRIKELYNELYIKPEKDILEPRKTTLQEARGYLAKVAKEKEEAAKGNTTS